MTIFENEYMICLVAVLAALILYGYMWLKANNACRNQVLIATAIYLYQEDRIDKKDLDHVDDVRFEDIEEFEKTVYRMTDWGYKRILPKEKYELVKPFIARAKKECPSLKSIKKTIPPQNQR